MNESSENPSLRNFTMLSRKIYSLFVQYMIDGRTRAPPETDLAFLISTFQKGAKTDRRALQSKFKSWARRMEVENCKLKLSCSGKEIIPVEDSCGVVMRFHSEGHLSVGRVIMEIQKQYTWSKKNFGMDRGMVVDFILKNCSNLDCTRKIGNEITLDYHYEDFIKDVCISSDSRTYGSNHINLTHRIQQNSSLMMNPSPLCSWAMAYPMTRNVCGWSPSVCDIQYGFPRSLGNVSMTGWTYSTSNFRETFTPEQKSVEIAQKESTSKADVETMEKNFNSTLKITPKKSRSFRKPKNNLDFKNLLEAAEQFTDYPAILNSPKTKFLGGLGLAPKRIISKRTIVRFNKEKKRRKAQEVQQMMYHKNRKNLRDRNKLNKIKLKEQLEQEKRSYLETFKKIKAHEFNRLSDGIVRNCKETNGSELRSNDDSDVEVLQVVFKQNKPEVIDLLSSDDENDSNKNLTSNTNAGKNVVSSIHFEKNDKGDFNKPHTLSSRNSFLNNYLPQENRQIVNVNSFSTELLKQSEGNVPFCPIIQQCYTIPSNSNGEIAVMPSFKCPSKVPFKSAKPFHPVNQSARPILPKGGFIPIKKPVLQPISNLVKTKNFKFQKLSSPRIIHKLPCGTNVYLMQKQPSGAIKMVPCKRVMEGTNGQNTRKIKEDNPISNAIPTRVIKTISVEKDSVNMRPSTEKVVALKNKETLDVSTTSVDEEMIKLSTWIGGMKSTMTRNYILHDLKRSKHKLELQLDSAIGLVKNIRRKLNEIEKIEERDCVFLSKEKD